MWKNIGLVVFAGLAAGSLVGVVEAVRLLLAVGAGEYDALLWGGVGYGLRGRVVSCILSSLLALVGSTDICSGVSSP